MPGWMIVLEGTALDGGSNQHLLTEQQADFGGFGFGPFGIGQPFGGTSASAIIPMSRVAGCLLSPPEGMGLPAIRSEDIQFPQRDGVKHFSDWYENRVITIEAMICPSGVGCSGVGRGHGYDDYMNRSLGTSTVARKKLQMLIESWSRKCSDVELVLFTDCSGTDSDRSLVGPFGVVGRPRAAEIEWLKPSSSGCARVTLRFDAVDHRMFILDQYGTPGSGTECVLLQADSATLCRTYGTLGKCYTGSGRCYDNDSGGDTTDLKPAEVSGSLCVYPTIRLIGPLTDPVIENLTTGETIQYKGRINSVDSPVVIDTYSGTATQDGRSRTHLLEGTVRWSLPPGDHMVRMLSSNSVDTGTVSMCWRPAVEFA